jgi:hypothetical protein
VSRSLRDLDLRKVSEEDSRRLDLRIPGSGVGFVEVLVGGSCQERGASDAARPDP